MKAEHLKQFTDEYKVKYNIKPGKFVPANDEGQDEFTGYCDAFVFISIVKNPDGKLSFACFGYDGVMDRTMSSDEAFYAWLSLASHLVSFGVSEQKEAILRDVLEKAQAGKV